jgi:hypothetical protein
VIVDRVLHPRVVDAVWQAVEPLLPHRPGRVDGEGVQLRPSRLHHHASRLLPRFAPSPAESAEEAAALLEQIADKAARDPRVIPLLEPAGRTSGEVIRPRDEHGRVIREVCTQVERRYSTVDLLAAEHELLQRAQARQHDRVVLIDGEQVETALAAFPDLDADQQTMVRRLAGSGAGVDVVVGKAGTGKTTAIRCYVHATQAAEVQVLGVAPSATARTRCPWPPGLTRAPSTSSSSTWPTTVASYPPVWW